MRYRVVVGQLVPALVAAVWAAGLSVVSAPAAQATAPGNPGLLAGSKIINGGEVTTATENPDGSRLILHLMSGGNSDQGGGVSWAPDGTRVAYTNGAPAVDTYLPDGTGEQFVAEGGADPTYTTDGATIIEAISSGPDYTQYQLYKSPAAGSPTGQQYQDPPPWFAEPTGGSDRYPSVSSTTGEVIFEHDAAGASDIWTDHGNATAGLLIANGRQPDISPDGSSIAFYRLVNGYDQLFVQAADGSGTATQVTSGSTNHTYPKWTPDGLGLDYNANPGTNYLDTVGHHLVLASKADSVIPGGLFSVSQQPTGTSSLGQAASFHSVSPQRLLDTRNGTGEVTKGAVPANGTLAVSVGGAVQAPSRSLTAAVLNVTVTGATAGGHLTVYPEGSDLPSTSNLNWSTGQTISNLVTVPVGPDGEVDLTNQSSGSTQVIADLQGYYSTQDSGTGYTPVSPTRILDTRSALGVSTRTPLTDSTIKLAVRGKAGVPAGADSVAVNLTAVHTSSSGYLEAYPDGTTTPTVSNVNWNHSGATLAGLAIVPIGTDGSIAIKVHGIADVLADVSGYFSASSSGHPYVSLAPHRLLDTRHAIGVTTTSALAGGHTLAFQAAGGTTGVPSGTKAVVLNITVTGSTAAGHVIAWADGGTQPTTSNLNWSAGQTIANQVIVPLGTDGKAELYVNSTTHLIADVFGYYS
ncbi:TolB family protein [Actinacidiphila sp. bgisy144]|uniref:TolB family protein n=1 Tax=Actinacidiphila sp. bgisy144 TaxID=3413791 RepID=UPI003EBA9E8F